jgi:hypothetical protein
MQTNIPYTDRLRERGFVDQWGFLFFALGGGAAIFLTKSYGAAPRWVTIGAVASMLLYALLIRISGTGRLRADQAGDNCYYLGLLYTLSSLAYSIFTFDPNNVATTIVQGFGIALLTTILGLILRVVFNQGRPDMENIEDAARLELTDAVSRLKGELNSVVRQVNDLNRQLLQSMQEIQQAATSSMQEFGSTSVKGIQEVASTASEAIRAEANDFAVRSKKYTTTFNTLLSKLDDHNQRLQTLSESHDAIATAARLTSDAVSASSELVTRHAENAASAATSANAAATSAASIMEQLVSLSTGLGTTLEAIREATNHQLADIRRGPGEVVRNSAQNLRDAVANLQIEIGQLSRTHEEARQILVNQGASAIESVRQHNRDLETELKNSRDLVGRVHSALADMTRSLAETVERG